MTTRQRDDPETVVYLIRHGMHDWLLPDHGRLAGAHPVGLNVRGVEEAHRAAALLAEEPLQWIASSPLQRTVETARIIARDRGLDVVTDERLVEWRFGPWEGMEMAEIQRRYPAEWAVWREQPDDLRLPGAETLDQVADRMETAYREWAARGGTGVLVSHQDPLSALLCRLIGAPLRAIRVLEIATGSLARTREASYGTVVTGINMGVPLA